MIRIAVLAAILFCISPVATSADSFNQITGTGPTPGILISRVNGAEQGLLNAVAYGATPSATVENISNIAGSTLTLGTNAPANGTLVAILAAGPACGIIAPTPTVTLAMFNATLASSGDTTYRYQLTAVCQNGGESAGRHSY
jgi:hypothetical protein